MLSENRESRRNIIDTGLLNLLYRRLQLTRELEDIDKRIIHLEGAMNENEAVRQDINTQAELDNSQRKEEL